MWTDKWQASRHNQDTLVGLYDFVPLQTVALDTQDTHLFLYLYTSVGQTQKEKNRHLDSPSHIRL